MSKVGNIFVELGLDYRGLGQGLSHAARQIAGFARTKFPMPGFGGVFAGLAAFEGVKAGLSGAASIVSGIKGFMDGAAEASSDLNETLSKTQVLLGQSAEGVIQFANELQNRGAAAAKDTLEAVSSTVTAFQNMGMDKGQAIDIAKELQNRFVDLASQDNARVEDVQAAFQSLIAGEIEPLRNFKIFTNMEELKKSGKPFGQAAAEEFLRQSERARGDFSNTSLSLANLNKSNEIQRGGIIQQVGGSLQPAYQAAAWFQNQFLKKFSDAIMGRLGGAGDSIFSGVSAIGNAILDNVPTIANTFVRFADFLGNTLSTLGSMIRSPGEYLRLALLQAAFGVTEVARRILPNAFEETRKGLESGMSEAQARIAATDAKAQQDDEKLKKMLYDGSQGKTPETSSLPRPEKPGMAQAASGRSTGFADYLKGIFVKGDDPQTKQLAVSQSMDAKLGMIAGSLASAQIPGTKPIGGTAAMGF